MRSQALIKPYFKYIFNFFEKILILSLFFDLHKIFADLHKFDIYQQKVSNVINKKKLKKLKSAKK